MAYEVHWRIDFVALNEDKYKIEILEDGYQGSVVYLRGGVNPIVTTEDNNENIFYPIRKQTGKLCIADTGYDMDGNSFDYTSLMPENTLERQVRLWLVGDTNTLRWIGYIRPDSLTSRLFEFVSIREYQIICPLGCLYEIPVSFSNNKTNLGTFKTMGQILHTALSSLHIDWSTVYKQNNVQIRRDITSKVSLINFISDNKPTHSTPSDVDTFTATWTDAATSWGNVLEEICKFWGWTLYSRGLDIYIVAQHQIGEFAVLSLNDLLLEVAGSYPNTINVVSISFNSLYYASTNHTESRKLGYREISIESNVNEKSTVLDPDYQDADMSYWPVASNPNQYIHGASSPYQYVLRRLTITGQNTITQFIQNYQIYENRQLATSSLIVPFVLEYSDGWKAEDYPTKTSFNFSKGICCYTGGSVEVITFFAKTLEDICLPHESVLCIDAAAVLSYSPDPDYPNDENTAPPYQDGKPVLADRQITVALCIGNMWWNPYIGSWDLSFATFTLTVRSDGSIVYPDNTFQPGGYFPTGILFDNHAGSSGHIVYNNTGMGICGRLKLIIYATPNTPTTYLMNCVLNNLTLSIYTVDSKLNPKNKSSQVYKGIATNNFKNNLSIRLNMASGRKNVYGIGQVYDMDMNWLDSVTYRNNSEQTETKLPEERLMQTMQNVYANITIQNTIEIMDNIDAETPLARLVDYWGNDQVFRLLCCSHNWAKGTMQLTLINK